MNCRVPSITQFPDAAYVLLKAVVRTIGTRIQPWVESKKSIEVLVRVLNLGPDVIDQLTRVIPPIEIIKYKAELLGLTQVDWSSIVLPEYATGWRFRNAGLTQYIAALQHMELVSDHIAADHLTSQMLTRYVDMDGDRSRHQCRNSDATFMPERLPFWPRGEDGPAKPQTQYVAEAWNSATLLDYLDCILDICAQARLLGKNPQRAVFNAFGIKRNGPSYVNFYTDTVYKAPGQSAKRLLVVFWPLQGEKRISFSTADLHSPVAKERENQLPCLHVPYVGYRYPPK